MNEVLSSDVICIRYTGVPNRSMLKGIFQWLKQTAKNIKLWDGKRKYIPKRKQGRKRYTFIINCSKHLARKFTQVMNILHT
jgi:hypothetical protein